MYLGKEPDRLGDNPVLTCKLGKSGAVIPRLMEGLLGVRHNLYVDNWYPSQELFHICKKMEPLLVILHARKKQN